MNPLLAVRRLRKEFPLRSRVLRRKTGSVAAVASVDLEIAAGETLALVGESGSGKTTLGRMIVRLIAPTAGEIRFRGIDLLALGERELRRTRRYLQVVFQDPYGSLNPRMTVGEAIFEPLVVHGLATRRERASRVTRLLTEVGLDGAAARRYPHEFSGGQRQRIGIARALASNPELIIADEPVSALDVSVRAQIVNLLAERQRERGLAMLFIAHDLALVQQIADRIAVLYLGRVVEIGPTATVLSTPQHPYTVGLMASTPTVGGHPVEAAIPRGGPPDPAQPPPGCPFHPRCPMARDRCRTERPELLSALPEVAVACHFPGEMAALAGGASGKWNFSPGPT